MNRLFYCSLFLVCFIFYSVHGCADSYMASTSGSVVAPNTTTKVNTSIDLNTASDLCYPTGLFWASFGVGLDVSAVGAITNNASVIFTLLQNAKVFNTTPPLMLNANGSSDVYNLFPSFNSLQNCSGLWSIEMSIVGMLLCANGSACLTGNLTIPVNASINNANSALVTGIATPLLVATPAGLQHYTVDLSGYKNSSHLIVEINLGGLFGSKTVAYDQIFYSTSSSGAQISLPISASAQNQQINVTVATPITTFYLFFDRTGTVVTGTIPTVTINVIPTNAAHGTKPFYKQWWFFAAVGAGVVILLVVIISVVVGCSRRRDYSEIN